MAKSAPRIGKNTRLGPCIEQIICWCAVYNIHLERNTNYVAATAYDQVGRPITRIVLNKVKKPLPKQEEDLPRAIAACDVIADELLILKPSVAWKLNHES